MFQLSLLLLQIIFTSTVVLSQTNAVPKGFAQIGPARTSTTNSFDLKSYYISENKVQWSTAYSSCKSLFGTNASTVSVQTEEEWNFLKSALEPQEIVNTYWTSGMWDRSSDVWRWADGTILTTWAPWDTNHPAASPNVLQRVLIAHANQRTASWRTVSNTQSHRFICEVPYSAPIPISCSNMDSVIVVDSSASIGSHSYKKARNFVVKLVEEFGDFNTSRIAFVIYSDSANAVIDLDNSLTPEEIDAAILNAPFLKGSTDTHKGIEAAIMQFQSAGRSEVNKNIVVITDGESSDSALTAAAVKTAINMGIRTFSVGITPSAIEEELLVIGGGDSEYVFLTDECDQLALLIEPLTRKICPDDD